MSWFKSARTTEHGYFEERISAYLDGELTPQEYKAVEHHLETCPECQWELETLRQTTQWARELPTLAVPRVFTVPVAAEPERVARRRWNLLPVLQGATALIAVLLVFAVGGDLLLNNAPVGRAPDAAYQQQVASIEMEATEMVGCCARDDGRGNRIGDGGG
jgi:anti-sigma factor RsiW